ncbi:MAG: hypothetical protein F6J98_28940 [Moorea sp. SIO4G2]|nr:hypothetical protein [Moorena sp. SIO3E8]NEO64219.1 hypothetical protein [Moorena sp. SIO4G2]
MIITLNKNLPISPSPHLPTLPTLPSIPDSRLPGSALSVGELNSPRVAPLPTPYSRLPTP